MSLTAKDAIARHMQWRITMKTAVQLREPLSAEQLYAVRHHRECLIGRWIQSPATAAAKSRAEVSNLNLKHIAFHKEMEKVASLLEAGRFEHAALALGDQSAFMQASMDLASAITALDKVLPILIPSAAASV